MKYEMGESQGNLLHTCFVHHNSHKEVLNLKLGSFWGSFVNF